MSTLSEWMTVAEAAKAINKTVAGVHYMLRHGILVGDRLGRAVFVRRDSVMALRAKLLGGFPPMPEIETKGE